MEGGATKEREVVWPLWDFPVEMFPTGGVSAFACDVMMTCPEID